MDMFLTAVLGSVAMCAPPALYVWLQWRALQRWRGGWRVMAWLPLPFAAFLVGSTVVGYAQHSNLWPLPVIFGLPLCLVFLGLAAGVRRLTGAGRQV